MDCLTTHTSLSPIWRGFAPGVVNDKKRCTQQAPTSDKAYQLVVHCGWLSPGTPASSTTKTGRHDIAEILLKVALNKINQIKLNQFNYGHICLYLLFYYYLLAEGLEDSLDECVTKRRYQN